MDLCDLPRLESWILPCLAKSWPLLASQICLRWSSSAFLALRLGSKPFLGPFFQSLRPDPVGPVVCYFLYFLPQSISLISLISTPTSQSLQWDWACPTSSGPASVKKFQSAEYQPFHGSKQSCTYQQYNNIMQKNEGKISKRTALDWVRVFSTHDSYPDHESSQIERCLVPGFKLASSVVIFSLSACKRLACRAGRAGRAEWRGTRGKEGTTSSNLIWSI